MSLIFTYKPGQDNVPGIEVMNRMRDMLVSGVRTELLSGLFLNNPEDLEVFGEVRSNRITITVIEADKKQLTRTVNFEDFSRFDGEEPKQGAGHPDDVDRQATRNSLSSAPDSVQDDIPFMPRVTLTKRVTEAQFRNRQPADRLQQAVTAKVKLLSRSYLKEFLAVKAERNRGK